MAFTKEELEEMRRADEEIERTFRMTQEDLRQSRSRNRRVVLEAMPPEKRKIAERQKAYREANREQIAERQKWIADERKARGMTQQALADLLGVSQPSIALLERGKAKLDAFTKRTELCDLLGR